MYTSISSIHATRKACYSIQPVALSNAAACLDYYQYSLFYIIIYTLVVVGSKRLYLCVYIYIKKFPGHILLYYNICIYLYIYI